jgi:DtxR family transcriptional regulator, Mn-dependent transcriptional regulator
VNRAASAAEDYVKVIYSHTEWQPEPITTSVLAARLGLAASSVTEMVKKLATQGLLTHVPYGAVELTRAGESLALVMVRRHRLIETWLVQHYGFSWDEVHDEAEVLEHSISDRLLERIDAQLGYPTRDPHGDPIPTADGSMIRPDAALLRDTPHDVAARVVRISDQDPQLLRHLDAEGISVDSDITVLGKSAFGGAFEVRSESDGTVHDLGEQAIASIWVAIAPQ